ncbi:5-nitroimidazole antibiotic resistance protein [Methanomicrobiaceae archaeon CYW5]|uniref:pyridoxamine 5'-phosphate oxidase family protein n=1 Tax=Methanovulcanius yangii TaxID=1789227 RepID=UPI0029CA704E|nr:pyridoxamine 5'-phosphate oxidase family protein [Methanovulcanius yangii]MBT8507007.1 5-nitroimidazole antibiotic resistance protein [Methanovulcanius yangii]
MASFRDMRRIQQSLPKEATEDIFCRGQSGVLAVSGDDDYPYAVPLNYAYDSGSIYFHCATSGHKLDAISRNSKVSFCVIDKDEIIPENFTTYFRSAIAFGQARILTDDAMKRDALELLVRKYSGDYEEEGAGEIRRTWNRVCVVQITIEHMTGKEAIELVRT